MRLRFGLLARLLFGAHSDAVPVCEDAFLWASMGVVMRKDEWSQRFREEYALQSGEVRVPGLPKDIEVESVGDGVAMRVSRSAVVANMQRDSSAFEAWSLALKARFGVSHLCLDWEEPEGALHGGCVESQHYERFLYRVRRFAELFRDWITVAHPERLDASRALGSGNLLLNVAGPRGARRLVTSPVRERSESDLEQELLVSREFRAHFGDMAPVSRQFPVGLFDGAVHNPNRVFPGGKSAIDLVGVAGESLLLFELKAADNGKAGILSELMFYAWVMRDAIPGPAQERPRFQFSEDRGGKESGVLPSVVSPQAIRACRKVEAVMLVETPHPLPWDPSLVAVLNEAAGADARANPSRVPIHFGGTRLARNQAGHFEFHDLA